MLNYNVDALFAARNIKYRAKFLMEHGISYNLANRIVSGQYDKMSLEVMEQLCRAFNCTPNDIYLYVPEKEEDKNNLNALMKLAHDPAKVTQVNSMMGSLPLDKLYELAEIINSKK